ncbi:putative proteinD(P)-BINDING ROSSMANN-FOLD SUPERFAMILY PROTEIN [Salix purpurea]|uniref:Uncharacterized protein n=1 Tax=Salix purpurea TaxID=77065 RepID=A0A9Q0ZMG1_SALPP|nr:putative proteinD(P)-BINDING ROSSMANN-FOLD SUPERFAMILY PROTEIN [Salix purpurea]
MGLIEEPVKRWQGLMDRALLREQARIGGVLQETNTKADIKRSTFSISITGCAKGGIGYEYCKAFAEHNCHVIASNIPRRMNEMLELESDNIETLGLDVSSNESGSSAVSTVFLAINIE